MDPLLLCFPGKLRCSFLLRAKAYNWSLFAIFSGNLGSEVAYASNKQGRARMDTCSAHFSNWLWLLLSCTRSQIFPGSTQSQHVERKGTAPTLTGNFISVYGPWWGERECGVECLCVCLLVWPTIYIHVSWAVNNTILSLYSWACTLKGDHGPVLMRILSLETLRFALGVSSPVLFGTQGE